MVSVIPRFTTLGDLERDSRFILEVVTYKGVEQIRKEHADLSRKIGSVQQRFLALGQYLNKEKSESPAVFSTINLFLNDVSEDFTLLKGDVDALQSGKPVTQDHMRMLAKRIDETLGMIRDLGKGNDSDDDDEDPVSVVPESPPNDVLIDIPLRVAAPAPGPAPLVLDAPVGPEELSPGALKLTRTVPGVPLKLTISADDIVDDKNVASQPAVDESPKPKQPGTPMPSARLVAPVPARVAVQIPIA